MGAIYGKTTMKRFACNILLLVTSSLCLSACASIAETTGKVAALPFKTVYKTGEFAGKTVIGTTKFAGKAVYGTGEVIGKTVYNTGKGLYYIGSVPVKITDKALDTTNKVLNITTKMVDLSGKAVAVTRQIQAAELNAELKAIRGAANVVSVFVDAVT